MKHLRKTVFCLALMAFNAGFAYAQKFDWNVNFQYIFDNSEYAYSSDLFDKSETINMVRLTPMVGLRLGNDSTRIHRFRAGVQLEYDMGCRNYENLVGAIPIYYNFDGVFRRGTFSAAAGVLPRNLSEGHYSPSIFDDKYYIRNNNIQGVLFKWRSDRLYAELACDWMGMYGNDAHPERRERFQIMSAGNWRFAGAFHLGWSGSFYHVSCAPLYDNVIDNHQINPFLSWEPDCWFQKAAVTLGGIFTYQRDRKVESTPHTPMGLMSEQHLRKWNVGIYNVFYWGDDLMPLWDSSYGGCPPYQSMLYFGEECFHTRLDRPSAIDLLRIYYEPRITEYLRVRVSVYLHLGEGTETVPVFRGWQQHASLIFDLDKLINRKFPGKKK